MDGTKVYLYLILTLSIHVITWAIRQLGKFVLEYVTTLMNHIARNIHQLILNNDYTNIKKIQILAMIVTISNALEHDYDRIVESYLCCD